MQCRAEPSSVVQSCSVSFRVVQSHLGTEAFRAVLCSAVLALCSAAPCRAVPFSVAQSCTVPCRAVPFSRVQCRSVCRHSLGAQMCRVVLLQFQYHAVQCRALRLSPPSVLRGATMIPARRRLFHQVYQVRAKQVR